MNTILNVSISEWTPLGTGLTTAIVEAKGGGLKLYVGDTAPAAETNGFTLPSGVPLSVPSLPELGGGVWVRATYSGRSLNYVTA